MAKKRTSKKTTTRAAKKTSRKASSARKKPAAKLEPTPLDESQLLEVVNLLVCRAMSNEQVREVFPHSRVNDYLVEARARIARTTNLDLEAQRALTLARYDAVFSKAYAMGHTAAAATALAQRAKLLGLEKSDDAGPGASDHTRGDELAKVEQHLRPLGLVDDDYPISELARIVAQFVMDHQDGDDAES